MEKLTPSLEDNLRTFRELFHAPENQDFVVRELEPGGVRLAVLCIDGMASRRNIESAVLRPAPAGDARTGAAGQGAAHRHG